MGRSRLESETLDPSRGWESLQDKHRVGSGSPWPFSGGLGVAVIPGRAWGLNGILFDVRKQHSLSLDCKPLGLRNNALAHCIDEKLCNPKAGRGCGEPYCGLAEVDPGFVGPELRSLWWLFKEENVKCIAFADLPKTHDHVSTWLASSRA